MIDPWPEAFASGLWVAQWRTLWPLGLMPQNIFGLAHYRRFVRSERASGRRRGGMPERFVCLFAEDEKK